MCNRFSSQYNKQMNGHFNKSIPINYISYTTLVYPHSSLGANLPANITFNTIILYYFVSFIWIEQYRLRRAFLCTNSAANAGISNTRIVLGLDIFPMDIYP